MKLRELQRAMKGDITHMDFLRHGPLGTEALLKDGPPLAPRSRLEIYAEAWFLRLSDSIAEDYPAVAAVLGAEAFTRLMRQYLRRHASRSFTLTHAGDDLPLFLEGWRDDGARPWLADLARLERAQYLCFHAEDPRRGDISTLENLTDLEAVTVRLESTVILLRLEHDVLGLWKAFKAGAAAAEAPLPSLNLEPQHVMVYRAGYAVRTRGISAEEHAALTAARRCTLAELLDASPQDRFAIWLQDWSRNRIIALTPPERAASP